MFNIIAVRIRSGKTHHLKIKSLHIGSLLALSGLILGLTVFLGFKMGSGSFSSAIIDKQAVRAWQGEINAQNSALQAIRELSDTRVEGLTSTIGEMQAQIFALQNLSQRLAKIAKVDLDKLEFMKANKTAPVLENCGKPALSRDLVTKIDELSEQLNKRSAQLAVLESLLVHSDLDYELYMLGRPVEAGYISSYYGQRADPFHGHTAFHKGIDFAGEEGAKIFAMAAGIVTFAGEYQGYGNFVEIDHGNGYTTRYAHNKSIRVKVGEMVEKGQVIAEMGTSGRSTGPHLHLEVMKNGQHLNPLRYVSR